MSSALYNIDHDKFAKLCVCVCVCVLGGGGEGTDNNASIRLAVNQGGEGGGRRPLL